VYDGAAAVVGEEVVVGAWDFAAVVDDEAVEGAVDFALCVVGPRGCFV
jgi:hypothetical protein